MLSRYNVYGGDQDLKQVFGDTERFLRYVFTLFCSVISNTWTRRWRVGLMERGLREIDFVNVDAMVQVHGK